MSKNYYDETWLCDADVSEAGSRSAWTTLILLTALSAIVFVVARGCAA